MRLSRRYLWIPLLPSIILLDFSAEALNTTTHRIVNAQAAKRSQLDNVLTKKLGMPPGLEQLFRGLAVVAWIGEGGVREDDGNLYQASGRFLRHFHDPLKPWDRAGLDLFIHRWESSITWMQRPNQNAVVRATGNWAWSDARRYYARALMEGKPGDRDRAWGDLFRALGQIMHLVVDASVPEHVRNDPHPLGPIYGNYEYWVEAQHGDPKS